MLCASLDGRRLGGEWTHVCMYVFIYIGIYMAESPWCLPETITTVLISYTPIQNKMFLKQQQHKIKWL